MIQLTIHCIYATVLEKIHGLSKIILINDLYMKFTFYLIEKYRKIGKYKKAINVLVCLLKLDPHTSINTAMILDKLGRLYLWIGNYEKGASILEKVLDLQQRSVEYSQIDHTSTLSRLGQAYIWLGNYSMALDTLNTVLDI